MPTPALFTSLADSCEALEPGEQAVGFMRAARLLHGTPPGSAAVEGKRDVQWIELLADSCAFESAAVALMPLDATFTGGRLADGSFVAQVVLANGVGSHSRTARSLSMAWLAALLRATARAMIEAEAVRPRV
jgi:hypothetical protein